MKYSSLVVVPLLLSGCGSDSTPDTAGTPDTASTTADVLFSSGGSCAVSDSSDSTGTAAENVTTVASTEAVNCPEDLAEGLDGPGISNTGNGSLTVDGVTVPLTTAIFDSIFSNSTESIFDLQLHNGEHRSLVRTITNGSSTATRIDTGTYNASAVLSMELAQSGSTQLASGSFDVDSTGTSSNRAVDVVFFIDKDGDGKPTTPEEVSEAASGNINLSGTAPDWVLSFDITLQNGSALTGNYTGVFHSD